MRLIDADKLIDELKEFVNSDIATKEDKETAGRIATYVETQAQARTVDVVSWKDFRDFLDDNAEDFDSVGKRIDALEQDNRDDRDSDAEAFIRIRERLDALEKRLNALKNENIDLWDFVFALSDDVAKIETIEERLKAIEEKIEGYVFE